MVFDSCVKQCVYGATSQGFLRTTKDNATLVIDSVDKLNQKGVIIGTYSGTVYETYVRTNLPNATIVALDYATQFSYVTNNQVHALIGDAIDFYS